MELTELEKDVLERVVNGTFNEVDATIEEMKAQVSVIDKAGALLKELNAYDELDGDMMAWFYNKYKAQK